MYFFRQGSEDQVQAQAHLTKVFIGGVSQNTTEEMIEQYFRQFGPVSLNIAGIPGRN